MSEPLLKEPKAYAHKNRRRRRITDELFRCPCPMPAGGISCGALLWRSDTPALREHLTRDHDIQASRVSALSDTQVGEYYIMAETITQPDINDDEPSQESDGCVDYE